MIYEYKARVRFSEVDVQRNLSTIGMLCLMQDTSVFHGEDNGATIEGMMAENITWVLGGWQVRFFDTVKLGDAISSKTWGYKCRHCVAHRNFEISADDGRVLAAAESQYVLMNIAEQKAAPISKELCGRYAMEPGCELKNVNIGRKIPAGNGGVKYEKVPVAEHMLDTNNHVNNLQYIRMAFSYLENKKDFKFNCFRAEFKKQARLGDAFYPEVISIENGYQVKLSNESDELYFIAEWFLTEE